MLAKFGGQAILNELLYEGSATTNPDVTYSFLAGTGAQVWAASNNVETCEPGDLIAGE